MQTSKTAQIEAQEKKTALQSKVRMVRERCSETDAKMKEITTGISQAKASIAKHQSSSKPLPMPKIVVSSAKDIPSTAGVGSNSVSQLPEIVTEPVSDCDTATSSPLPLIEVEPITDSEFSDSPSCLPLVGPPESVSLNFEAVSDVEMDVTGTEDAVAEVCSTGDSSTVTKQLPSTTEQPEEVQQTPLLVTDGSPIGPMPATVMESMVGKLEDSEADIEDQALTGTNGLPMQQNTTSSSFKPDLLSSNQTPFVASRLPGVQHPTKPQLDSSNSPSLIVDDQKPDSSSVINNTDSSSQSSDENLIPTDRIFCLGTYDLFTLGLDEQPQLVVPIDDLRSLSSLDVEAACISQPVLTAIQERSNLSYCTRTGCEYSYVQAVNPSREHPSVTPSLCDSITENSKTPRSARARKQKKPVKITSERRQMLEQQVLNQVDGASAQDINSTADSAPDSFQVGEDAVSDGLEKEQKSQAQDVERLKVSSLLKSDGNNPPIADDGVATSKVVDMKVASLLQRSFKQAFPKSSPLTLQQTQAILSSFDSFLPTQITPTLHPSSTTYMGSVLDSINFFQGQSLSASTKLPSNFPNARRSEDDTKKRSQYVPYSSPLLCFSSYMLSPAYRQHEKLQLGSPTYSNKLDPKELLCKYEMLGVCKDPKCTAQHVRDSVLSREEVIASLVSNAPQLAGCSNTELEEAAMTEPSLRERIMDKVNSYSSSVIRQYSPMISDEEIYKLTAHQVNKARKAVNPEHQKHHFVSFNESSWLQSEQLPETSTTTPNLRIPEVDLSLNERGITGPQELVYSSLDKLKV